MVEMGVAGCTARDLTRITACDDGGGCEGGGDSCEGGGGGSEGIDRLALTSATGPESKSSYKPPWSSVELFNSSYKPCSSVVELFNGSYNTSSTQGETLLSLPAIVPTVVIQQ